MLRTLEVIQRFHWIHKASEKFKEGVIIIFDNCLIFLFFQKSLPHLLPHITPHESKEFFLKSFLVSADSIHLNWCNWYNIFCFEYAFYEGVLSCNVTQIPITLSIVVIKFAIFRESLKDYQCILNWVLTKYFRKYWYFQHP